MKTDKKELYVIPSSLFRWIDNTGLATETDILEYIRFKYDDEFSTSPCELYIFSDETGVTLHFVFLSWDDSVNFEIYASEEKQNKHDFFLHIK